MAAMKSSFFALVSRMSLIERWGLMRSTVKEDVAQHTLQVAMLAHALCTIENELFDGKYDAPLAAVYALYHETAEVLTGDLPTPVKYYDKAINTAYKRIERRAEEKILATLPDELRPAYTPIVIADDCEELRLVKCADKLCALIKCVQERKAGNTEFDVAYESTLKELQSSEYKSVAYFMENFLPAYSESLDILLT